MSTNYRELTEETIKQTSLADLQIYSFTVSSVIAEKTASIQADKDVQAQYEYLILNSQSTITGFNYEILQSDNAITARTVEKKKIQDENVEYDSTIRFYTERVGEQKQIIDNAVLNISSLTLESSEIDKYIEQTNSEYVSSTVGYSSLYMVYTAKDIIYKKCLDDTNTTRIALSNAIIQEAVSLKIFEGATESVQKKKKEVDDIYLEGTQIQSRLSQTKIEETNLVAVLVSTNVGITALSSLYETAVLNQQYYQLLSTQAGYMDSYTTAKVVYETAVSRSIADPMNNSLATATAIAQQRLSVINTTKQKSDTNVAVAQKIVNGATNDSYAVNLAAAEGAISLQIQNSSTFQGYKNFATSQVTYYSSLYEKAGVDIVSSIAAVESYNTFYNSSINGSNALITIINRDISSIAGEQATIDALSLTMSSLYIQHSDYTSSYSGHMVHSSLMKRKADDAKVNIAYYTSLYTSTSTEVAVKSKRLEDTEQAINNNNTVINTLSSIIDMEQINMLQYKTDIAASFNTEELSAYKYRETFVRVKKANAQKYFEACVLDEVQKTSTQNGKLKELAGNTPITLMPINLNTDTINLAYTNITTINSFLNTFSNIYTNYTIQKSNLDTISTTINNKQNEYSSFVAYSNKLRIDPTNASLIQTVLASKTSLVNINYTTNQNLNNIALTQNQINASKDNFLFSYQQIFVSNDIIENEKVISSFLIQGFNSAVY